MRRFCAVLRVGCSAAVELAEVSVLGVGCSAAVELAEVSWCLGECVAASSSELLWANTCEKKPSMCACGPTVALLLQGRGPYGGRGGGGARVGDSGPRRRCERRRASLVPHTAMLMRRLPLLLLLPLPLPLPLLLLLLLPRPLLLLRMLQLLLLPLLLLVPLMLLLL